MILKLNLKFWSKFMNQIQNQILFCEISVLIKYYILPTSYEYWGESQTLILVFYFFTSLLNGG